MRRLPLAAALLAAAAPPCPADNAKVKVEVVKLSVGRSIGSPADGLYLPVGEGTAVAVLVSLPDKAVTALDTKASKIVAFADDKKTELIVARAAGFQGLNSFLQASADKHHALLEFRGGGRPAAGASKVVVKATVVLKCATGEKVFEAADFAPTAGAKTTAGPAAIAARTSGGAVQLDVESEAGVKKVEFLDADGKPVAAASFGSFTAVGAGGKPVTRQSFAAPAGKSFPAKITVKVTAYDKTEDVTVPIDVEVGLGW